MRRGGAPDAYSNFLQGFQFMRGARAVPVGFERWRFGVRELFFGENRFPQSRQLLNRDLNTLYPGTSYHLIQP